MPPSHGHPDAQERGVTGGDARPEAAKIVYTATALEVSEPSLTYVDAAVVWSESGTCFFIREQTTGIDYGTISGGTTAGNAAAATFAGD